MYKQLLIFKTCILTRNFVLNYSSWSLVDFALTLEFMWVLKKGEFDFWLENTRMNIDSNHFDFTTINEKINKLVYILVDIK